MKKIFKKHVIWERRPFVFSNQCFLDNRLSQDPFRVASVQNTVGAARMGTTVLLGCFAIWVSASEQGCSQHPKYKGGKLGEWRDNMTKFHPCGYLFNHNGLELEQPSVFDVRPSLPPWYSRSHEKQCLSAFKVVVDLPHGPGQFGSVRKWAPKSLNADSLSS